MTHRDSEPHSIDIDLLWPRDDAHRYRVYARDDDGLHVIAATDSPAGIGIAITQLHEDQKETGSRFADLGMLGILDVLPSGQASPTGEWIVVPFPRSRPGRAVS